MSFTGMSLTKLSLSRTSVVGVKVVRARFGGLGVLVELLPEGDTRAAEAL